MQCNIYKASTRDELYVYVATNSEQDNTGDIDNQLDCLPAELRKSLGRPQWVMQLTLTPTTRLARVPIQAVLDALAQQGFFVQFPPDGLISPTAMPPEGLRGA